MDINLINHVAIYLRISQEKKGENVDTLINHRSILTDYATEQGWTYHLYEEVLSGGKADINERPKLQSLLAGIEKYDGILVVELSRLSRNGLISETVLQTCVDNDVPIITREKIYDLSNDQNDVLNYRFGALIASQEHALIGKRSKNNKIVMAKQGLNVSGIAPWGYVRNQATKRLEIVEEQANVIQYIYRMYLDGEGSYRIRDILNGEGYKTATGKFFSLSTVIKILKNPTYKGTAVFNDRKRVKREGKFVYESVNEIAVDNAHPPIISTEDWERANELRLARARLLPALSTRNKPANKMGILALKDLLYCGECGWKLSINKDKGGANHIRGCNNIVNGITCSTAGLRVDYVESVVMAEVGKLRGKVVQQLEQLMANDGTAITDGLADQLARINKQIAEQEKVFSRLIDLALEGVFTVDEIAGKKASISANINSLKAEADYVTTRLKDSNTQTASNKLQHVLTVLDELQVGATPETLNQHLKRFIRKIHYSRSIPIEVLALSTNKDERRNYPFSVEIEYL